MSLNIKDTNLDKNLLIMFVTGSMNQNVEMQLFWLSINCAPTQKKVTPTGKELQLYFCDLFFNIRFREFFSGVNTIAFRPSF